MTRAEVIDHIGTIAKSGTRAFLGALETKEVKETPELIGQFGVGFYSAFMVADKVELVTRRAGSDEPATLWTSEAKDSYSIDDHPRTEQGTTVTLHLKEEQKGYLEEWKIRSIIKKYSDFIEHPIILPVKKKEKDESEHIEEETLNSRKAIWIRSPQEVSDEDYNLFYNHLVPFDQEPPLARVHYTAEGSSEFKALLYIPSKAPFNLFVPEERRKTLHLYIRRVFISDECAGLLPEYFRFVKGVVDSSDLPLNISREMLQDNPQITKINKNLVRKLLSELKNLLDNSPEKYRTFFKEFGRILKEGVHSDFTNKDKIRDLLLFETMRNEPGKLVSLKEYATAMPEGQKEIYYIVGENRSLLENSPHLEVLKRKGYDVLFMTDPIDEWVVNTITDFEEKKLKAVGKGELDIEDEKSEDGKKAAKKYKSLLETVKAKLGDRVKDVRFSTRLADSACCLVSDEHDPSAYMERLYKAMNQEMPKTKRILEINPTHPLVESLGALHKNSPDDPKIAAYAELLIDQALLTEGNPIPDPLAFSKRLVDLMVAGLK
jgi:molecular chaperone HtpG